MSFELLINLVLFSDYGHALLVFALLDPSLTATEVLDVGSITQL
jgi:hypothetical protein